MLFVFKIMKCEAIATCPAKKSLLAAVTMTIQLDMQRATAQTAFFSWILNLFNIIFEPSS